MKRGRKNVPCPEYLALRAAYERDPRPAVIARAIGANVKQVRRWLGEIGIELPPRKKLRPRGETPRYVRLANLANGGRKACRLYMVWDGMWSRCLYPRAKCYDRYGGRGIKVCDEWREYDTFRAWAIAHGFRKGLSLDRINTDGNYEPLNCRWLPMSRQQWSGSRTIHLTLNGVTKPLPQWADELDMPRETLRTRRSNGWTDEQILTTPKGATRIGYVPKPRGRRPRVQFSAGSSSKE